MEIQPGSTQLVLDAQALGDLVPDKFAQVDMFQPLDPRATCLDVFADALDDALVSKADSDLYDDGLIETLTRFGRVLDHDVDSFEIRNGRTRTLDRQSVQLLRQLRRSFPADQRTRVAGKLDLLKHSSRIFSLLMSTGELRCVVVADADQIVAAEGDTTLWQASPRPLLSELEARPLRVPQGPWSGVAALFGQWPGDESFFAAKRPGWSSTPHTDRESALIVTWSRSSRSARSQKLFVEQDPGSTSAELGPSTTDQPP